MNTLNNQLVEEADQPMHNDNALMAVASQLATAWLSQNLNQYIIWPSSTSMLL
jgi:hypothetical protein